MIKRERELKAEFDKKVKALKLDEQAKEELFTQFTKLYEDGFKCAYCNERMGLKYGDNELAFTIDHILARVRGGSDNIRNLTFCCQSCNSMKKDKDVDWFLRNVKRLKLRKKKNEYWKARKATKQDARTREAFKDIFQHINAKQEREK